MRLWACLYGKGAISNDNIIIIIIIIRYGIMESGPHGVGGYGTSREHHWLSIMT